MTTYEREAINFIRNAGTFNSHDHEWAHINATLAVAVSNLAIAEQLRIANLTALSKFSEREVFTEYPEAQDALADYDITSALTITGKLLPDVAAALKIDGDG